MSDEECMLVRCSLLLPAIESIARRCHDAALPLPAYTLPLPAAAYRAVTSRPFLAPDSSRGGSTSAQDLYSVPQRKLSESRGRLLAWSHSRNELSAEGL